MAMKKHGNAQADNKGGTMKLCTKHDYIHLDSGCPQCVQGIGEVWAGEEQKVNWIKKLFQKFGENVVKYK
jgi:hypothetical protein